MTARGAQMRPRRSRQPRNEYPFIVWLSGVCHSDTSRRCGILWRFALAGLASERRKLLGKDGVREPVIEVEQRGGA
jgi:hypothetical protein